MRRDAMAGGTGDGGRPERRDALTAGRGRMTSRATGPGYRRRGVGLQLVTVALLAVLLAVPNAVVAAAPTGERVYLALGNSLAVGVGATRPDRVGYVPRLFDFFHGTAHDRATSLVNLAVPGATSGSFISSGRLVQAVAAIDADSDVVVVTLDIGGNDLFGLLAPGQPCALDPVSPTCQAAIAAALGGFATAFPTILDSLTKALARDPGEEQILVATYFNPFSGTGNPYDVAVDRVLLGSDHKLVCAGSADQIGLNDLIACIGGQYGATVVDVYPLFAGKGASLTHIEDNDIHPTNAGYAAIANAFRRAFKAGT